MFAILYPVSEMLVGGIPRLKLPLKLISPIKKKVGLISCLQNL